MKRDDDATDGAIPRTATHINRNWSDDFVGPFYFFSFVFSAFKNRQKERERKLSNQMDSQRTDRRAIETPDSGARDWQLPVRVAADAMTADDNHDRRQSTCLVFFVPPLPNFILFFVGSSQREEVERGLLDSFKILSVLVFSI